MREHLELPKSSGKTPSFSHSLAHTAQGKHIDKEGTVELHVLCWAQHLLNVHCLLFMGQTDEHGVTHLML